MSANNRTAKALALLIPAGVLGISSALATTQALAEPISAGVGPNAHTVADQLMDIRKAVSALSAITTSAVSPDVPLLVAEWLNFRGGGMGWHNGGWGNGGWHNGGWGNGWHNGGWGNGGGGWRNGGWGNGGWHNW